jgi:hypothetical protein
VLPRVVLDAAGPLHVPDQPAAIAGIVEQGAHALVQAAALGVEGEQLREHRVVARVEVEQLAVTVRDLRRADRGLGDHVDLAAEEQLRHADPRPTGSDQPRH